VSENAALRELCCDSNQLSTLDVTANTALQELSCVYNRLTTLDVSANAELQNLNCQRNQIGTLDVSHNAKLKILKCSDCGLTAVDVSHNPALEHLEVHYQPALTSLDLSNNPLLTQLEAEGCTGIRSLDLSHTPLLKALSIMNTGINAIDITPCAALVNLVRNTELVDGWCFADGDNGAYLYADNGQVLILDNGDTYVFGTGFTTTITVTFDANGGWFFGNEAETVVTRMIADGDGFERNLYAEDLQQTDPHMAFNGWYLDAACTEPVSFDEDGNCYPTDDMTVYAKWTEGWLVTWDGNGGFVNGTDSMTLAVPKGSSVNHNWGIEREGLGFAGWYTDPSFDEDSFVGYDTWNYVPTSDVTLYAKWLPQYAITLNANGGYFWGNPEETSIDNNIVQGNSFPADWYAGALYHAVESMFFDGWYLDAACTEPVPFEADGNYYPTGDMTLYAKWTEDSIVAEINATNFPDDAFRAYVSNNFDSDGDGWLSRSEIKRATYINVESYGIADLTGIAYFTDLQTLYCDWNQLTTLDVSANTALRELICYDNQLAALNVSGNTALQSLNCSYNQLTTLDVSGNAALEYLNCSGNRLTTLDVSANISLRSLECSSNQLTAFDVSGNTALQSLSCGYNQLTTLDVSSNAALVDLWCSNNQLTALDVSCNGALKHLYCFSNQLITLTLSEDAALASLECSGNRLTSLDLSHTPQIRYLNVNATRISTLDISPCTALVSLLRNLDASEYGNTGFDDSDNDIHLYADHGLVLLLDNGDTFVVGTGFAQVHTLTFDANGGWFGENTEETQATLLVAEGAGFQRDQYASFLHQADPHMILEGWYLDAACTDPVPFDGDGWYYPTSDLTVYAKWTEGWIVTFDGNGGLVSNSTPTIVYVIPQGSCVGRNYDAWKEGYEYDGWYLNAECTDESRVDDIYSYVPTSDVTFYAKWVPIYTVTFDANGGYFWGNPESTYSLVSFKQGTYFSRWYYSGDVQHVNSRLVFDGWYLDPDCTDPVPFDEMEGIYYPTGDMTVYAKWSEGWVVTFDANGYGFWGDMSSPTSTSVVRKGEAISSTPSTDNINGMIFEGWYLDAACTDENRVDNVYDYVPDGDVTFYAKWKPIYTITFNANGGYFWNDPAATTHQAQFGAGDGFSRFEAFEARNDDPHMAFGGWYYDAAGLDPVPVTDDTIYPTESTTLYLKWEEGWIVTFNANGGYLRGDPNITSLDWTIPKGGIPVGVSFSPDKDDYLFDGWYLDAACTDENRVDDVYDYVPDGDVTFYAKWVDDSVPPCYDLTFDANGGTFPTSGNTTITISVAFGGNQVSDLMTMGSATPTWDGHEFSGWYCEANKTYYNEESWLEISGDMTLTAQWTEIEGEPMDMVGMQSRASNKTDDAALPAAGNEPETTELEAAAPAADPETTEPEAAAPEAALEPAASVTTNVSIRSAKTSFIVDATNADAAGDLIISSEVEGATGTYVWETSTDEIHWERVSSESDDPTVFMVKVSKLNGKMFYRLTINGVVSNTLTVTVEWVTPEPEAEAPAAEPETTEPEAAAPAAEPETTEPEAAAPAAEPEMTEPEAAAPAAEPETTEPEAAAPAAEPETTEPEAAAPAAELETTEPEAAAPAAEPETTEPEAAAPAAEPETTEPEAAAPAAESEATEPEAAAPAAEPETTEPEAAAPAAEPETTEPEAAAPAAEPETTETEAAAPAAEPETTETEAAAPAAEPEATEPEAAALAAEPEATEPENTEPETTVPVAEPEPEGEPAAETVPGDTAQENTEGSVTDETAGE